MGEKTNGHPPEEAASRGKLPEMTTLQEAIVSYDMLLGLTFISSVSLSRR